MNDFNQYLQLHKATNATQKEKDALFKAYEKEYFHEYNKQRKNNSKAVKVTFPLEEFEKVSQYMQELKMDNTAGFIRQSVHAYMDQTYILPDESVLREVALQIKYAGGKLHQIAHLVATKITDTSALEEAKAILLELENYLFKTLAPVTLRDFVIREHEKDPFFLDSLREILETYKPDDDVSKDD